MGGRTHEPRRPCCAQARRGRGALTAPAHLENRQRHWGHCRIFALSHVITFQWERRLGAERFWPHLTLRRRHLFGPLLLQGRGSATRRLACQGLAVDWESEKPATQGFWPGCLGADFAAVTLRVGGLGFRRPPFAGPWPRGPRRSGRKPPTGLLPKTDAPCSRRLHASERGSCVQVVIGATLWCVKIWVAGDIPRKCWGRVRLGDCSSPSGRGTSTSSHLAREQGLVAAARSACGPWGRAPI